MNRRLLCGFIGIVAATAFSLLGPVEDASARHRRCGCRGARAERRAARCDGGRYSNSCRGRADRGSCHGGGSHEGIERYESGYRGENRDSIDSDYPPPPAFDRESDIRTETEAEIRGEAESEARGAVGVESRTDAEAEVETEAGLEAPEQPDAPSPSDDAGEIPAPPADTPNGT